MTHSARPDGDKEWDVLVIGGGIAGVAAAVSAARAGAATLLVERSELLGGSATLAFVHTFCGLFLPHTAGETPTYANPGFAERLARRLIARGGAFPPEIHGKVAVVPTCPEKMGALLDQTCHAISNLEVACSTHLQELRPLGEETFFCSMSRPGGVTKFHARFVIDTSGDAHAAEAVGAPMDVSSPGELQHPTYIFRVSGANPADLDGYERLKLAASVNRGSRSGLLPPDCDSVLVRASGTPGEAYISLNMPKPKQEKYDPLNEDCLRMMEKTARKRARALIEFLRQEIPGWQSCEVLEWPRRLGVRETRRIRGRYAMTADDILQGRRFENEVALSTWPIELWNSHTGAEFRYPDAPCGIPIDALISAGHPRLGMAGRCMSATHEALGALRVMGTAMATGEAIGLATALAAARNCDLAAVDAQEIRKTRQAIHLDAGDQP